MNARHILQFNAAATVVSGLALLAARAVLFPLFGLSSPLGLDLVAIVFLAYAGALAWAAAQRPVARPALLAFAAADALCAAIGAAILVLFWQELAPIARTLVVAVTLFCEVMATLQYRAAGRAQLRTPQPA